MRRLMAVAGLILGSASFSVRAQEGAPPLSEEPKAPAPAPELVPVEPPAPETSQPVVDLAADAEPPPLDDAPAVVAEPEPIVPIVETETEAKALPPAPPTVTWSGFLRLGMSALTPDRFLGISTEGDVGQNPYVGRNDGLWLGNARLTADASPLEDVAVRLSIDGAAARFGDKDSPIGTLTTVVQDAWVRYALPWSFGHLTVGRLKPPYDVENLNAEADQAFVHRALESRGVARQEGNHGDAPGLSPGRQLGLVVSDDVSVAGVSMGLAVAVTNGNASDQTLNDNDTPTVWARLTAALGSAAPSGAGAGAGDWGLRLGLSAFWNEVTVGTAPALFRDRVTGMGFDVAGNVSVLSVRAQALAQSVDHLLRTSEPSEYAWGGHAEAVVQVPDTAFSAAYRFALYDPRTVTDAEDTASDFDRLTHHTVGVRYHEAGHAAIYYIEYTHAAEQAERAISNDRLEAALHIAF